MTLRASWAEMSEDGKKGDWCFLRDDTQIAIQYGDDGIRNTVILPISTGAVLTGGAWAWDGNREAPTLAPSILVHPYEGWTDGWHGYFRAGQLVEV